MSSLRNFTQKVKAQFYQSSSSSSSPASTSATATNTTTINQPTRQAIMSSNPPGITIYPAPHGANVVSRPPKQISTPLELLSQTARSEFQNVKNEHLIQSSFTDLGSDTNDIVQGRLNGFVDTCVQAYNSHHKLVIRPDDVWMAILSQLNIYVNAHAEELRAIFVSHEGQKKLVIELDKSIAGEAYMGVDWGKFSWKMSQLLASNLNDPTLLRFFLPEFTTTTKSDQAVASIMMMSTVQKYFAYSCCSTCGLPSVTLLGQKSDWEKLIEKAERLPSFGAECATWHSLLVPVLKRFVRTFESPDSQETRSFWQRIAHYYDGGSGPTYLSGWITAFCFWDVNGKLLYTPPCDPSTSFWQGSALSEIIRQESADLKLDSVSYHRIETEEAPPGWASVPVELNNYGVITDCVMVAGLVGMRSSCSGEELHRFKEKGEGEKTDLDTVQVESGWWMYEAKGKVNKEAAH